MFVEIFFVDLIVLCLFVVGGILVISNNKMVDLVRY